MLKRLQTLLVMAALTLALPGCGVFSAKSGPVKDPGTISFEGALANRFVRAGEPAPVIARLRVGTVAPPEAKKPPINLALVIDTSGSMEGKPIEDARAAATAMIDALSDGDKLAVIAFHSTAEVLLPSTELDGDNKSEVKARVQAMKAQGTTDMSSGLRAGLDEVNKSYTAQGINRIVLVGDGVPNNPSLMHPLAAEAASRGISITTLGLGPDFNEVLMGAVAQTSGGRFHYVEKSEQVADYFHGEVLRLQAVYARNAVVSLTPGPGVHIESVLGMPTTTTASGVEVTLGDLSRDDKRDLIVKLSVDPKRDGAPVELLDAVVSFDDAMGEGGRVQRRVFLGARSTSAAKDIEAGRNPDVEDAAASTQAAAATIKAIETARSGDNARAQEVLDQAANAVDAQADATSNVGLRQKATSMRALKSALPNAAPAIAPMPSPAGPPRPSAAAPSKPKNAAEVLRRAHDEAMQQL